MGLLVLYYVSQLALICVMINKFSRLYFTVSGNSKVCLNWTLPPVVELREVINVLLTLFPQSALYGRISGSPWYRP